MVEFSKKIQQLDAVAANISKAEKLLDSIDEFFPDEPAYIDESGFDNLVSDFNEICGSLPSIDGWRPQFEFVRPNEFMQAHFDARDIMEHQILVNIYEAIKQPAGQLSLYRHRYQRQRARITGERIRQIVDDIDRLLDPIEINREKREAKAVPGEIWGEMSTRIGEIESLLGRRPNEIQRWMDLRRHIHFAEGHDLFDIIVNDWPTVRDGLQNASRAENEPIPTGLSDLNEVGPLRPDERISTELDWKKLNPADFERLIFNLIDRSDGYENPQWLSKTNAPDRGRDLSADHVIVDSLSGTCRERVIVQCKHYLKASISPVEVSTTRDLVSTWEPPVIDTLVFATSGRFTADAIKIIEQHNSERRRPKMAMWPESHLEKLLSLHPDLIAEFGLR